MKARYNGTCKACGQSIDSGVEIRRDRGVWVHDECAIPGNKPVGGSDDLSYHNAAGYSEALAEDADDEEMAWDLKDPDGSW